MVVQKDRSSCQYLQNLKDHDSYLQLLISKIMTVKNLFIPDIIKKMTISLCFHVLSTEKVLAEMPKRTSFFHSLWSNDCALRK